MTFLALFWGARVDRLGLAAWYRILGRFALLGGASLVGYFISTPYAFLDPYLFRSVVSEWSVVRSTPYGVVTIWSWVIGIWADIGSVAAAFAASAVVLQVFLLAIGKYQKPLVLAVLLSLSQLAWYGLLGKLWVVPGYLLVAYGLMAVLSFNLLFSIVRGVGNVGFGSKGKSRAVSIIAWGSSYLVLGALTTSNLLERAALATTRRSYELSTQLALNRWAVGVLPHDARILFDDLAYFDPKVFSNARMNANLLTWWRVMQHEPQYIVLTSSLYDATWIADLIRTQRLSR
jgi:hypothetical protein